MPSSYTVSVETGDVERVIASVEHAISQVGLEFWLREFVSPFLADQIIDTFAGHGAKGSVAGRWPELSDGTIAIRHAQGYYEDDNINDRTGALLEHLVTSRDYASFDGGAMITVPGNDGGSKMAEKIRMAQVGKVQGPGDMLPGAVTPPRPVLGLAEGDQAQIMAMLRLYVVQMLQVSV